MRNTFDPKMIVCIMAIATLSGCGGSHSVSTPPGTVSVSPSQAAVVASTQAQQFLGAVPVNTPGPFNWAVDGVVGGNASVGTITAAGLYTPSATAGTHTVTLTNATDSSEHASASVAVTDLAGVTTYHNNVARDGTNTQEWALKPATLGVASFGKRFACAVDGAVYTQPLWVPSLSVGGTIHNVIFVATQHDSAYAFDADASPCVKLWQAALLDTGKHGGTAGETPVPAADVGGGALDIQPEIGVTGTPVIDPATSTLYVISKSEDLTLVFHQRLHALDLTTGNEKFGGPIDVTATFPGTGDGSTGGNVSFNAQTEGQRSALSLSNGIVYIAWASHEDKDPYHGWILGYNASNLAQVKVLNVSPDGSRSGIWMAGGAPAFDAAGNLYASTGNGTFDASSAPPNTDYGNTLIKISTSASLTVTSWFTPYDQDLLNMQDLDLGSSGVVILPDQASAPTHLLIAAGKEGKAYLLNRDSLGSYCSGCPSDTNVVQSFVAFQNLGSFWGTPAFWQNHLYLGGTQEPPAAGDTIKLFDFNPATGLFNSTPASQSGAIFGYPGSIPSVSSQGANDGILWDADISAYGVPAPRQGPAVLHAYDATNLGSELWNSTQAASNRDQAGNAVKFTVPTVANGKVYIGTRTEVDVYGLLP